MTAVQAENESLKQQLEELHRLVSQRDCQAGSRSQSGGADGAAAAGATQLQGSSSNWWALGGMSKARMALQAAGLLAYFLVEDLWLRR